MSHKFAHTEKWIQELFESIVEKLNNRLHKKFI